MPSFALVSVSRSVRGFTPRMQLNAADAPRDQQSQSTSEEALVNRLGGSSATMPAPFPLQPDPVPTSSSVGQSVASVGSIASSKITEGPIRKLVNRNIEKRVTRSSLGGQTSREGSALGSDGQWPGAHAGMP